VGLQQVVSGVQRSQAPDIGEPAPFFSAATDNNERYSLDVAAGRWIVLMIFGSLTAPASQQALEAALARRSVFNDWDAAFYGVSVDRADRDRGLKNAEPGVRFFWDFDCAVGRLYGLANADYLRPAVFLIDPSFRIAMAEPIERIAGVLERLEQELANAPALADSPVAPVLTLPRIVEPDLCAELIGYFRNGSASPSGFAIEIDGRTVQRIDPLLKRREDVTIQDEALVASLRSRLETRLFPMVERAFGWRAKHIERYLICRYRDQDQGFFFPHRDDVTAGTAHRKFAVSLNLNAEDYKGGDLRFPEFGPRTYRPPTGGATVFCCSLLHEATPVTRGARYVFVPFLYDDEGEKLRRANLSRVGDRPASRHRSPRARRP
jgi:peroxiredoxin/predicted 2-oxoglutarate/Fe(II)-dependent dioxygenase YbiX